MKVTGARLAIETVGLCAKWMQPNDGTLPREAEWHKDDKCGCGRDDVEVV